MRRRFGLLTASLSALSLAGGCTDLPTPAELSHAQILAVRADPPVVEPGESAVMSLLVAGPEGAIDPDAVRWSDNVEVDGAGVARFVAPAEVRDGGHLAEVEANVELADGAVLDARKAVGVGLELPAANPTIEDVFADEERIAGSALSIGAGSTVTLDIAVDPAPPSEAIFSWYSTVGEIDLYRRAPTELVAPDEAMTGLLIAVYRDGLGVAWRQIALTIE